MSFFLFVVRIGKVAFLLKIHKFKKRFSPSKNIRSGFKIAKRVKMDYKNVYFQENFPVYSSRSTTKFTVLDQNWVYA